MHTVIPQRCAKNISSSGMRNMIPNWARNQSMKRPPITATTGMTCARTCKDISMASGRASLCSGTKRVAHSKPRLDSSHWKSIMASPFIGRNHMPHFVSLLRYTQQGMAKIKESPARLDAAKKAAEKADGKVHAWYLTMGRYDAVLISEFPSDEAAAKFTLSVGSLGNVSTETLKAFTETEYRKIVGGIS